MQDIDTLAPADDRALYEADEHAWIARQIDALRSGRLHSLDRESLIEVLTDMAAREERELKNWLIVLVHHLLKIVVQPGRHTRSWNLTVLEQQQQIRWTFAASPSLRARRDTVFAGVYDDAVGRAATETGLPSARFPAVSPWTIDEALAFVPPAPPQRTGKRRA